MITSRISKIVYRMYYYAIYNLLLIIKAWQMDKLPELHKSDIIFRLPLKMKSTKDIKMAEQLSEMGVELTTKTIWANCSLFLDQVIAWYDHGVENECSVVYGTSGEQDIFIVGVSYYDFDRLVQKVCKKTYYVNVIPEWMENINTDSREIDSTE
jgi:hypothetical protein